MPCFALRPARFLPALLLVLAACGGAAPSGRSADGEPPAPRDAAAIAEGLVHGRAGVLVFVDRVRNNPIAPKIAGLDAWGPILEGTGIDPAKDLDRVFATVPDVTHGEQTALVGEHAMPEARVKAAVDVLVGRSAPPGEWIADAGVPAARVTIRGHTRIVALPTPRLLVVLPDALARDAARFAKSGGCPDPEGTEAALAAVTSPHETLRAPHVPPVPPTIRTARAKLSLSPDGSADVAIDAIDESADQAQADAVEMTRSADQATSLSLGFVKVRVFPPIAFHADDEHVKSEIHLSASDVDRLVGLAGALTSR